MKKEEVLIEQMRNRSYFFDKGVKFGCLRCGDCCTGEPGIVYASEDELHLISFFLDVPLEVIKERFTNTFLYGYTLREVDDGRCIFYENGCVIYPVRPLQCKTFPFWFQNMRSMRAWKETCKRCRGIGKGTLYTKEQILERIGESYPIFIKVMEGSIRL